MEFVNVTGHHITLDSMDGTRFVLAPAGPVARIQNNRPIVAYLEEWPVRYIEEGTILGLPTSTKDRYFIASNIVSRLATARGRHDVLSPDVSQASVVRDRRNNVKSVRGLVSFSPQVGGDL